MKTDILLLAGGALALATAGCLSGDDGSAGTSTVTLSLTATSGGAVTRGSPTIEIQRARMLLREIELEHDDSAGVHEEFEGGPLVLDVPLDGSPRDIVVAEVPVGSYDEIEFEVESLSPDDPASNDLSGQFDDFADGNRLTVIVEGAVDGERFVYESRLEAEKEIELREPLEVRDGAAATLSLTIDLDGWFRDDAGNSVDPRDPAAASRIDANIRDSFEGTGGDDDDDDDD